MCAICSNTKWFCPNITSFPKMTTWNISGGCSPPPPPRLVHIWIVLLSFLFPCPMSYYFKRYQKNVILPLFASDTSCVLFHCRFLHMSPEAGCSQNMAVFVPNPSHHQSLVIKSNYSGADPGFSNRGGTKDHVYAAYIPFAKLELLKTCIRLGSLKLYGFGWSLMVSEPYFDAFSYIIKLDF